MSFCLHNWFLGFIIFTSMIRISILLSLFCFYHLSIAQNFDPEKQNFVDSLKIVAFNTSNHDTMRVNAYLGLATHYYLRYMDSAEYWIGFAEELSERSNYLMGMSQSYGWMGFFAQRFNDTEKSLEYNFKSIDVLIKIEDYASLATALNNIAVIYSNKGDYAKSIYYQQQSLKTHEHAGNIYGQALSFNNIAFTYETQNDYKKAEEYFFKSLEVLEEVPKESRGQDYYRGLATAHKSLGGLYKKMGKLELGMKHLEKAFGIASESGDKVNLMLVLNIIGMIQVDLVEQSNLPANHQSNDSLIQAAIQNYEKAIEIGYEINYQRAVAASLKNIASVYYTLGNTQLAKKYAEESYTLSIQLSNPEVIKNSAYLLSVLYEEENRGIDALQMYKMHIKMRDSLFNIENQKMAIETQTQYEYEKKKALDDADHSKELALKEEEKKRQSVISYAATGGAISLALFLFIVFNRLKITRKQKRTIEEQKIEVEKAHFELGEKNQEILDSITYAKRIQTAILPPDKLFNSQLSSAFVLYLPKDIVAGDFYWMEPFAEASGSKGVMFAAADCTGHGVPGAMVSVICNSALNRSVREFGLSDPGKILDKTREIVLEEFEKSEEEVKDGMDIALCKLQDKKLEFAGAHNPLWIVRNGEIIEQKGDKQPVGKFEKSTPFTTAKVDLQDGDTFYIFSDGFADQFGGEKGKKYKAKNFKQFLISIQDRDISEHEKLLKNEFNSWKENFEQLDDVCVIGVRV